MFHLKKLAVDIISPGWNCDTHFLVCKPRSSAVSVLKVFSVLFIPICKFSVLFIPICKAFITFQFSFHFSSKKSQATRQKIKDKVKEIDLFGRESDEQKNQILIHIELGHLAGHQIEKYFTINLRASKCKLSKTYWWVEVFVRSP